MPPGYFPRRRKKYSSGKNECGTVKFLIGSFSHFHRACLRAHVSWLLLILETTLSFWLFQSFSISPSENTSISAFKGPRDKGKSSQVNPKVILVQWGVGVNEAIFTILSIYFKIATTKTILILVEGSINQSIVYFV